MATYWDAFLNEYGKALFSLSLKQILELFWTYCNQPGNCNKVLKGFING